MEKKQPAEENLSWEEISTEHIVHDEWIDFRKSAFRFPDGRVFQPYYSYTRRDYAVVVASDVDGQFICVRQFRQGIHEVTTEFPAGAIEKKDGTTPEAAALEAARRELREETGYVSDSWRPLLSIPSNATISDNIAWLFVAENCRPAAEQQLDEMELLRVRKHSAQEIDEMVLRGEFKQSVHALAWLLARKK